MDWDGKGWTVVNTDVSAVSLLAEDRSIIEIALDKFSEYVRQNRIRVLSHSGRESKSPQIQTRLLQASEADLADATRRFQLVSRALRGESPDAVPSRTLRRRKASYLAAQDERERLSGFAA